MVITSCGLNDKQENSSSDWQALFDGKTFDGWDIKVAGYDLNDNHNNTYLIEDGSIVVSYDQYDSFDEKDGNIFYTKKKFKNYHLKLDYKFYGDHIRDGDWSYRNSGVMLHSEDPKKIFKDQQVPVSIEAQFLGGLQNRSDGIKTTLNMCSPGTDVDIEVHITPEDHRNGVDTQLDKALEVVRDELKNKKSVLKPDFKNKPNLKLPN